jgi:cytochrome c
MSSAWVITRSSGWRSTGSTPSKHRSTHKTIIGGGKNMIHASRTIVAGLVAAAAMASLPDAAYSFDEEAALALAKANRCLTCHAVDKDKEDGGPAYKKVAAKYKDKPDAEETLIKHLTTGPMVKFADGHEEEHKMIKTKPSKDLEQIRNLLQWILAQ